MLHFYRRVIEVPSLDWREVSEHFYGNCCCASFGAQAELLAARFQQLLTSSQGTCLVASTTCIVHKGDVITSEGDRDALSEPVAANHIGVETSHVHISDCEGRKEKAIGSSKTNSCAGDHFDSNGSEHHSNKLAVTLESELNHHQNGGDGRTTGSVAEEIQEVYVSGNKVSPGGFESKTHEDTAEEPYCSSSCSRNSASSEFFSLKEGKEASPESLGNGFMTGSQNEVLDWDPFFCRSCSSLIGARRVDSSKNGLQFFKCKISTHESVLSSSNIFR